MKTKSWHKMTALVSLGMLAVSAFASGCTPRRSKTPTPPQPPAATATPIPTETPTRTPLPPAATPAPALTALATQDQSDTGWKDFVIADFEAVHSPVRGDANQHLIFGNIPVSPPAQGLSPDLAAFLGRWEGYDYLPPAAKDNKGVLVIQEINSQGGKAYLWGASILQYPFWVKQISFKVIPGASPAIEWLGDLSGGPNELSGPGKFTLSYDRQKDQLAGSIGSARPDSKGDPIEFSRGQSYYVYTDYEQYFAGKRIYPREYRNRQLQDYGQGYLLYLPPDYEKDPQGKWPLIFFLIGTGERGEDPLALAKHGPWNYICQKGPLPFIIVAPMLHVSNSFRSFPEGYLDGALDEALSEYRVDPKRIYLTGLSMGGEAAYRYALHRPEAFAALAAFAAFNPKYIPSTLQQGFKPFTLPMERIKDLPVWAIHGANDPIVPLSAAQKTVNDLVQAGVKVKFTVLEGHDHDAWTDVYNDPAFYDWLLQYKK